jgi:hypothetical protein
MAVTLSPTEVGDVVTERIEGSSRMLSRCLRGEKSSRCPKALGRRLGERDTDTDSWILVGVVVIVRDTEARDD